MANTSRQTAIFGVEDWKRIYQTYQEADFQSYDFETIRKSFVDYLRTYYPESFNDFVESSEFVALLDVVAFMGQSLAFRSELNARENFLETAERRESVVKLAELVSYSPKRNEAATGLLKLLSVSTTENVVDYNGNSLSTVTVSWDDATNPDWFEQMVAILNAAMVNSQRIGRPGAANTILGVEAVEYTLNAVPGSLPVRTFSSRVSGVSMPFELVSATVKGVALTEVPPTTTGLFNMLFRNDQLGFASDDTGFFFMFKQGALQTREFFLSDRIPNRSIALDIAGVNETDVWVFSTDDAGDFVAEWTRVDSLVNPPRLQETEDKRYFSVTAGADDRITLQFGDGVFSQIPTGSLRVYARSSNGLEYVINPSEMQSVTISLPYISRTNRVETITFTMGLMTAVSNARARETIDDIKARAPARYYTQNRMVNGEDYSNFPFTRFGSIIKSKAVNRTTIGASRYLDLVDVTGKYSSTNVFGSDGALYKVDEQPSFSFTWSDLNDISNIIVNQLEPALSSRGMTHYYYANGGPGGLFERPSLVSSNIVWQQVTVRNNEATGYFRLPSGPAQAIGVVASDNKRYLVVNSLVKFVPPAGSYFTSNNRLVEGTPSLGEKTKDFIWATITAVQTDGANYGEGVLDDGSGPVAISVFVPTGAVPVEVVPAFASDLPAAIEQEIATEITFDRNFGLVYNHLTKAWSITHLFTDDWLVWFDTDGVTYTVEYKTLSYYFASIQETRFYYDGTQQVYDSKTGLVVNDYIRLLKTNARPSSNEAVGDDVILDIVGQPPEVDGHINDHRVSVSFADTNADGIADNPDFFDGLVDNSERVFFELSRTIDNLEETTPLPPGTIRTDFVDEASLSLAVYNYSLGSLFYTEAENRVFEIIEDSAQVRSLRGYAVKGNELPGETAAYVVNYGRPGLQYHYRHNSPTSRRIDPGTTNIIDLYVITNAYYQAYQRYLRDSSGTVPEPVQPTINDLSVAYAELDQYKMVSDNIVLNSVVFKPLFGDKAIPELRASIKVVRNLRTRASDSEIKSKIIQAVNNFFTIDKWDFGDTFYFSELSAYLHKEVGDLISSAVVVPRNSLQKFGDLFEVRAAPNEIFVSAATVNDIEVIDTITSGNIRAE